MNFLNIIKGWKTTILAVLTVLATIIPPTKEWLVNVTDWNATALFGLVMAIYLALRKDPTP